MRIVVLIALIISAIVMPSKTEAATCPSTAYGIGSASVETSCVLGFSGRACVNVLLARAGTKFTLTYNGQDAMYATSGTGGSFCVNNGLAGPGTWKVTGAAVMKLTVRN